MDTLHVARMRARYHLPAAETGARERLDRVLHDVLDEALEHALARAGVDTREEVCIRHVHAPVRLGLQATDGTLSAAWSAALSEAIRATLTGGGAGVVRYGSRGHALTDLLTSLAAGDFRRAWAWRQLGLWGAGDSPSAEAAAYAAVRALLLHRESVVRVVAAAARAGALPALVERIRPELWTEIARAALLAAPVAGGLFAVLQDGAGSPPASRAAAGTPRAGTPQAGDESGPPPPREPASPGAEPAAGPASGPGISVRVARVFRTSGIARAAAATPRIPEATRRALAVLAVLEAEPTALSRGEEEGIALVLAVDRETAAAAGADPGAEREAEALRERTRDALRRRDDLRPTRRLPDAGAGPVGDEPASDDEPTSVAEPGPAAADTRGDREREREPVGREADPHADAGEDRGADDGSLPEVRRSGATRWGGLLFLLRVLDDLGAPDEILDSPVFAARPFRWVLHRLALELLALDEGDAAALAFAGLAPDSDPPSRGEAPATEAETAALGALGRRVAARLYERVHGDAAPDDRTAGALLREVCRREARIDADPAWIDVRLLLREVTLEVRRAGLDLDPGWIPWLGAVVRFVYE